MTIQQLRAIHHATPFKPFTIHVADGRSFRVPHRDFLSQSPGGRSLFVFHDDEAFSVIDLLLVTELEAGNGEAARRRRRGKN
ncbi:MAG: hypothetical protein ACREHD_06540 [Pirellulales bacterium]